MAGFVVSDNGMGDEIRFYGFADHLARSDRRTGSVDRIEERSALRRRSAACAKYELAARIALFFITFAHQ
ncbi:hypothetical protein [Rhizobium leguminosarum]|uniref:hypothetical protein n=1 Tax=Rhizobium leguminosarum TaxID=384 RepID=UPI001C94E1EB|nr:hypothetical protein [Rhizobium leguminosarum]MBY5562176.1 hypothetical protein [Rhizobium leguminosarum]